MLGVTDSFPVIAVLEIPLLNEADATLVVDQVIVELPPVVIVVGLAIIEHVGLGITTGTTVTVLEQVALPPAPVTVPI